MASKTKSVPEGYHTVTPYLIVNDAAAALDFYARAFGAKELFRFPMPNGKIGHAEMRIGDSHIMIADEPEGQFAETPDHQPLRSPRTTGGRTSVGLSLYVDDVDNLAKQAVAAGAKELRAVVNQFYGDRSGTFQDPFGHVWTIATHVEDVSPEEMMRRAKEAGH